MLLLAFLKSLRFVIQFTLPLHVDWLMYLSQWSPFVSPLLACVFAQRFYCKSPWETRAFAEIVVRKISWAALMF